MLNAAGVVISKRQVVRLLVAKLETFRAEDEEVLTAGLSGSRFVTVDDTGARHQGKPGFTTHIGSDRFAVFRTGPSKSRLAFLRNLRAGRPATSSMKPRSSTCETTTFPRRPSTNSRTARRVFPSRSGLDAAPERARPDRYDGHARPGRVASEGALWGALQEEGRLGDLVIVSDGAGQFRVGVHAQCWIHAERLVHKLTPANQIQHQAVEVARRMIWWFYGRLKEYKLAPSPGASRNPARAIQANLQSRQNRIRGARQLCCAVCCASRNASCASSNAPKSRSIPTRLGKRHPRLRDETKNLRRNGQRKGASSPRRHARPRQDLQEAQHLLLPTISATASASKDPKSQASPPSSEPPPHRLAGLAR